MGFSSLFLIIDIKVHYQPSVLIKKQYDIFLIEAMVGGYHFYLANVCVCPCCNMAADLIHPNGSIAIKSVIDNIIAVQFLVSIKEDCLAASVD